MRDAAAMGSDGGSLVQVKKKKKRFGEFTARKVADSFRI